MPSSLRLKVTYYILILIASNIPHLYLLLVWNLGLKSLKSWGVFNDLKQILQMVWNKCLFILHRRESAASPEHSEQEDAAVMRNHGENMVGFQQRSGEWRVLFFFCWFWPSVQSPTSGFTSDVLTPAHLIKYRRFCRDLQQKSWQITFFLHRIWPMFYLYNRSL